MTKGVIKIGSSVGHDHGFFKWPSCKPPMREYEGEQYLYKTKDPYKIFNVHYYVSNDSWVCSAEGYGMEGSYGNGPIYVRGKDSICLL